MDKKSLVTEADHAYYNLGEEVMTDEEFDSLGIPHGLDTPVANYRMKATHRIPMGSLKKFRTDEELNRWKSKYGKTFFYVSPKLDGNSIELVYINGKLDAMVTRGDGTTGNDITDKAKYMPSIPQSIGCTHEIVILRGEAIMPKIYQERYEKSIRNVVSGKLNSKEIEPNVLKLIDFICFDVFFDGMVTGDMHDKALFAIDNGIRFVAFHVYGDVSEETLIEDKKYFDIVSYCECAKYMHDGVVIEALNPKGFESATLDPEDKIAFKFMTESAEAEIGSIDWTVRKHGKIYPVVNLKVPVILENTTVSRATASNYSLALVRKQGIGAKIKIIKSGSIIPKMIDTIVPSEIGLELPLCPACNEQSVLEGVHAVCKNPSCTGAAYEKLAARIEIFKIDGVSDATINALHENGIKSISDIFSFTKGEIQSMIGSSVGEKIYEGLGSKPVTEAEVISASLVPNVSETTAKKLLSKFKSISNLILQIDVGTESDFTSIKDVGTSTYASLKKHGNLIGETYNDMMSAGIIICNPIEPEDMIECCVTGTWSGGTRDELKAILKNRGYKMNSSVTSTTKLLLTASLSATSTKTKAAEKKGIPIMTYDDFLKEDTEPTEADTIFGL